MPLPRRTGGVIVESWGGTINIISHQNLIPDLLVVHVQMKLENNASE